MKNSGNNKASHLSLRDSQGGALWFYYHPNHLSSTMYVTDMQQSVVQCFLYAPYGEIISEYNTHAMGEAFPKYSFNAKELDEETGMYYYEARYYAPPTFISRDPLMSEKPWLTPYHYCSNNPVGRVDPSGMLDDWYEDDNGNIKWTDCKSQKEMDEIGIKGTYLGEIVVLFEGSTKEKLGKNSYLNGDGAEPAKVTVYGKSGYDDIENYTGFTMTSNYEKYGAIDDGYYDVVYDKDGKSGKIPSHYAVEKRRPVDCLFGKNNAYSNEVPNSYSETQKDGIFVHRTNMNGFAGANVSTGCPLILGSQWNDFEKQIGQNGFKMIIRREHFIEHKCILK